MEKQPNEQNEEEKSTPSPYTFVQLIQDVNRRYCVGDANSTEYGLQVKGDNVKIEIKRSGHPDYFVKMMIDDRCYNSRTTIINLDERTPF